MLSDLAVRVLSAIGLGIPVILAVYAGSPYFDVLIVVAAAVLAWEWFRLVTGVGALGPRGVAYVGGVVIAVACGVFAPVWLSLVAVALVAGCAFAFLEKRGWLAAGVLYLALPCTALLWLRHDELDGRASVFWLLAVVWASDVGAYFSGRLIGGPKLAPSISPNKTWAGFAGGAVAAVLAGAATVSVLGRGSLLPIALASVAVGIFAQGGDLLESWFKRYFGVKDTSRLIPGHGGILDRVDGLMAAAVLSALIAAFAGGTMFA